MMKRGLFHTEGVDMKRLNIDVVLDEKCFTEDKTHVKLPEVIRCIADALVKQKRIPREIAEKLAKEHIQEGIESGFLNPRRYPF